MEFLVNEESLKLRGIIQQQLLSACTKNKAKLLISYYYTSFTTMLRQAFDDLENLPVKKGPVIEIIQLVIQFIEDLISLIESRFVMYLSLDENVPKTYFHLAQKELSLRLKKLQRKIPMESSQKISFEIISDKLNRFINTNEFEHTTSYKNILYKKKPNG